MAPGGKIDRINRLRSELQGNILKRRRLLKKEKKKKRVIVGAVIDKGLITSHHLKKRCSSKRANITLSGKKKRKLQKQIRHSQREQLAMDVEPATSKWIRPSASMEVGKTGSKVVTVEMKDEEMVE
ncbi:uncharacterized protein C11orf98 homolog [Hemiscyllium ocellatum]|uniref:uncharacterized protein C11orf98 homolog n=1 Tax=Hemiscyllium ocellatum TaxID=170820 RepID=UPI0029677AEA|nr:uncharacterized protein C11orf98 homolog [Hemiscyllium ocellatum]